MTEHNWMPRYVKYLMVLAIPIQIVRWLLGSIWGILILSVALYYLVQRLDWIDTFGFNDLALWFDSLPQASKSTIGAAMLTVVGFLIAFQLAYRNTTREKLIIKELNAANAIHEHYQEIQDLAGSLHVYSESILKAVGEVSDDPSRASFWADYLLSMLEEHHEKQRRLVQLIISGHTLGAYWSIVTLRKLGLPATLERMAATASELMSLTYFVPLPDPATTSVLPPDKIVLHWFDEKRTRDYYDGYAAISARLIWPASWANSLLHSKITPDSINVWLNILFSFAKDVWAKLIKKAARSK